jgi:hypothetical protein
MQIDWPSLLDFMRKRDAALVASFRGVARTEIDAMERECSVRLPSNYVSFLQTMGEDSGALYFFGPSQVHQFSALREMLPPDGYAGERFFKVSFESDELSLAFLDHFLDMQRSDGIDAPLVRFETGDDVMPAVDDIDWTFGEEVIACVFREIELWRRTCHAKLNIFRGFESLETLLSKQTATDALLRYGLRHALTKLKRVAAFSLDELSALVTVPDSTNALNIELASDDLDTLKKLAEWLCAQLPSLELVEPPLKRSDRSSR